MDIYDDWDIEAANAPVYDCITGWNDTYTTEDDTYVYYQKGGWDGPTYKVLLKNNYVDLADIANKPERAILDNKGFLIGWAN